MRSRVNLSRAFDHFCATLGRTLDVTFNDTSEPAMMLRLISRLSPALASVTAYAQSTAAEAPVEKASGVTVVLFLVLFVGMCVGYGVWAWRNHKKEKEALAKPLTPP
jgi:hypothetical protein